MPFHPELMMFSQKETEKRKRKKIGGALGGSAVEHLPWAQGVIPGSWDRVLHRAPRREPVSPSTCVSASLCLSGINK